MTVYKTTRLLLTGAAVLSFAGHALALDGQDLLKKINAAYSSQGGSITADSVDVADSTVTLKSARFVPTGGTATPLGTIVMSNVEEDDDGGYYIETTRFDDINKTDGGTSVTAKDLVLGGISVPGDPKAEGLDGMLLMESATTGPISVKQDGAEVFSISGIEANNTLREDESGFDFDATVKDISADLSKTQDAESREAIDKLGLQHIKGTISTHGAWDIQPGTFDLSELAVDFENIGRLTLSAKISGYTLAFIKSIEDASRQAQVSADKEQAQQALGLSMLGLVQQLSFESAQIRFEDASITKRALDYAGAKQNMSAKQMAEALKAMAPMMLAQINNPAFQNAVTAAVGSFLDNPKSLTVAAAPAKPVPFPMILGAAMGSPNTLPDVLGAKVSANN